MFVKQRQLQAVLQLLQACVRVRSAQGAAILTRACEQHTHRGACCARPPLLISAECVVVSLVSAFTFAAPGGAGLGRRCLQASARPL